MLWRFIIVRDNGTKKELSRLTHYGSIIENATVLITVYLYRNEMYDYAKDVQSIEACIQNMLLAVYSMGLGAVWLGQILNKKEGVNTVLGAPGSYELMAVVAIGILSRKTGSLKERSCPTCFQGKVRTVQAGLILIMLSR